VDEARRLVAVAALLCGWTAVVVAGAALLVLQSTGVLCRPSREGPLCPDGIAYAVPSLGLAAAVAVVTFVPVVLLLGRRPDPAFRWRVAGDGALVAALPPVGVALLLMVLATSRGSWLVAAGALAVAALWLAPVVAHRAGRPFLAVAPVVAVLAAAGAVVEPLLAVLTVPTGVLLLAATYVGRGGPAASAGDEWGVGEPQSSHQSQD
jgi:hypothetical protein